MIHVSLILLNTDHVGSAPSLLVFRSRLNSHLLPFPIPVPYLVQCLRSDTCHLSWDVCEGKSENEVMIMWMNFVLASLPNYLALGTVLYILCVSPQHSA